MKSKWTIPALLLGSLGLAFAAMAGSTTKGTLYNADGMAAEWMVRKYVRADPQGIKESYWKVHYRLREGDEEWVLAEPLYTSKEKAVAAAKEWLREKGFTLEKAP